MEDPKVSDIINNDYVLITLYVDNKTPLSSPVKLRRTVRSAHYVRWEISGAICNASSSARMHSLSMC